MRNALLALLAGGMPIGGMAAQMQNPQAPENDPKALRDIWFDKLRERLTGLFMIDGTLHDTYRQSWVATITPSYVEAGREPLVTDVDRSAGRRRQAEAGREQAPRGPQAAEERPDRAARIVRGRSHGGEAVFGRGAQALAVAAAGSDDRGRLALRDVHGDGVHVSAAARQQRRGHLRSADRPAVHERPRDLRDLLALPVSHGVPWRRAHGRRQVLEDGRPRDARAVPEAARRAARDGEGALREARAPTTARPNAELVLDDAEAAGGRDATPTGGWCRSRDGSSTARACCCRSSRSRTPIARDSRRRCLGDRAELVAQLESRRRPDARTPKCCAPTTSSTTRARSRRRSAA